MKPRIRFDQGARMWACYDDPNRPYLWGWGVIPQKAYRDWETMATWRQRISPRPMPAPEPKYLVGWLRLWDGGPGIGWSKEPPLFSRRGKPHLMIFGWRVYLL